MHTITVNGINFFFGSLCVSYMFDLGLNCDERFWCPCSQEKLNSRTIDDELVADPELTKEVDEEISKGSYY